MVWWGSGQVGTREENPKRRGHYENCQRAHKGRNESRVCKGVGTRGMWASIKSKSLEGEKKRKKLDHRLGNGSGVIAVILVQINFIFKASGVARILVRDRHWKIVLFVLVVTTRSLCRIN